jgi:uncharacterized protein YihD (DUF1040 family)
MRDNERIEKICIALANYWQDKPDLRLGQVLNKLLYENKKQTTELSHIIHTEDDVWLQWLKKDLGEFNEEPEQKLKYDNKFISMIKYKKYGTHKPIILIDEDTNE